MESGPEGSFPRLCLQPPLCAKSLILLMVHPDGPKPHNDALEQPPQKSDLKACEQGPSGSWPVLGWTSQNSLNPRPPLPVSRSVRPPCS